MMALRKPLMPIKIVVNSARISRKVGEAFVFCQRRNTNAMQSSPLKSNGMRENKSLVKDLLFIMTNRYHDFNKDNLGEW